MVSPVWRIKFCGPLGSTDTARRQLQLEEKEFDLFEPLLDVCCGAADVALRDAALPTLLALGRFADKFQVRSAFSVDV